MTSITELRKRDVLFPPRGMELKSMNSAKRHVFNALVRRYAKCSRNQNAHSSESNAEFDIGFNLGIYFNRTKVHIYS